MRRALVAVTLLSAVTATACDKIPGLSKKDADGGAASSSGGGGGGVLSFLGGTFEGEITMNVSSKGSGGPRTMVFGIKKPKVRIDASGGVGADNPVLAKGAVIIADPPAKKAYMLLPSAKQAMLIDFEKAKAARAARGQPGTVLNETPKIEKLGTKETIAGYECENWRVSSPSKGTKAEMCVSDGITWVDLTDLGMANPEIGLAIAASDANRFPLRVVGFDTAGAETMRMQATKIEKKTLDANAFVVPPDYKVMDMTAVLGAGFPGTPGAPGVPPGLPPGFIPPKPK